MSPLSGYTQLEILSFDRIAFAHSLVSDNYCYQLNTQGYGIYGRTPKNGGILEIGFVEQNPLVLTGESGQLLLEENGIFIIPPHSNYSVTVRDEGLHRHTSAEFLIRCHAQHTEVCTPPSGKTVVLPLYIPPPRKTARYLPRSAILPAPRQPRQTAAILSSARIS